MRFGLPWRKAWLQTLCACFIGSGPAVSCAEAIPTQMGPFRPPELLDLARLNAGLHLDIRYASSNNFMHRPVYPEARAFLQRPAAEALIRVQHRLEKLGLGLMIFDAYRPWSVTKIFWDGSREEMRPFLADPAVGSRHNRGCAVDLTLFDLNSGREVTMPSGYDEMTERAYPSYRGGTAEARRHRDLLRRAMESEGFSVHPREWWHFDHHRWSEYAVLDIPFSEAGP